MKHLDVTLNLPYFYLSFLDHGLDFFHFSTLSPKVDGLYGFEEFSAFQGNRL
jgi:hypothetical protein